MSYAVFLGQLAGPQLFVSTSFSFIFWKVLDDFQVQQDARQISGNITARFSGQNGSWQLKSEAQKEIANACI
jgi:hypothetical protein